MFEAAILWDWIGFALRWLHVITAIAWIGSSFYFIALDLGNCARRRTCRKGPMARNGRSMAVASLPHPEIPGRPRGHAPST